MLADPLRISAAVYDSPDRDDLLLHRVVDRIGENPT